MTRITLSALLLCAAAAVAGESVVVTLQDGKTKRTLTLIDFDEEGVNGERGGRPERLRWDELTPESAFAARKALTPFDDGARRLELAEFAAARRLYPEAQEELEVALALGGLDEAAFEKRAKELEAAEVAFLCERIDALLKSREHPSVCLRAIKRLRERYPDHPNNKTYAPAVDQLVEALATEAQAAQDAATKRIEDKALARLREGVLKLQKKKARELEKAKELREASVEAIAKRQVSRVKNSLVAPRGAERYYKRAKKYLRAIAKLDPRFEVVTREDLEKEWDALDGALLECYLGYARILMGQRNYKGAVEYVRKILYLDPIHEEALDMKAKIEKNRITFKMSDITNARPRVTGG